MLTIRQNRGSLAGFATRARARATVAKKNAAGPKPDGVLLVSGEAVLALLAGRLFRGRLFARSLGSRLFLRSHSINLPYELG
jgi:hypothetical protein